MMIIMMIPNDNGIGTSIKYPISTVKTAQFGEWPSAILNQTDNLHIKKCK